MKAFLAFLVVVAGLAGLYFGYVFVVSKSFQEPPQKKDPYGINDSWQSQSQKNDDLMQRQRDLIRQRQDQIRDKQRR